ncbi:unnamed protein product [Rotaria sordida]|uniref:Uncharacterized protein n=1 Tax=Rotaria sordida TaxID=392033 RepID=A0A814FKH8_9BILA|nr:unnamed protein product [Rotaria sordida]CAF1058694.1 unnamed protein product [Rotaria sordida]
MEEFHNQINQLRRNCQQFENIDITHIINEIEQIGQQLKYSQEYLLKEIQRLKKDLDINYTKLNYANELRTIDQITLTTFKTKFDDLTQLLTDIKNKEINAWHILQILRVNTSRLWYILETAIGTTLNDKLIINEDLEKLLNFAQIEKNEQTTCLNLLEKEHGDLLIKMKNIQLTLEYFRTSILQITQNINEIKLKINNQEHINNHIYEQSSKKINNLILNIKDIEIFLNDYKFLINEIHNLLKLIFHIQTQIEIHHKTIFIYQNNLEKYKQNLILNIINRTNYENQILNLKKILQQQNENFQQLKNQQIQFNKNRQKLYQQIDILEIEKNQILNHQQQLINIIKQSNSKKKLLEKEIFHSNHTIQNLQYSYRKLSKDHNKQHNITNNLQKTIQANEERLQITKIEINKFSEQVKQQNYLINSNEIQFDSHTKELQDLENCLLTTHEELNDQRRKVNENKIKIQLLKQKLYKIISDEKPLAKEISYYQKQIKQNEINFNQIELNLKQNETKINQYKIIIRKLMLNSKQNNHILIQNNLLLEQYHYQTQQIKENIKILNQNLKHSEYNYQILKEIFHYTENENRLLKQQYADLTFVVQLLGHRQAMLNNELEPLYKTIKRLSTQHLKQDKIIEQSKSDLNILHKYHYHLRSYNQQLQQSISFKTLEHNEYLHSQSISNRYINFQNQLTLEMKKNFNHIHYWYMFMISSPDKFNNISKLFLIKKKLVHKTNEFINLKKIFNEKKILYRYLNQIYIRRQKLYEKINAYDVFKNKFIKQNKL